MLVVRKKKPAAKKKPTTRKKTLVRRKFGAAPAGTIIKSLHSFTLAHVNPFDRKCFDCRVPDQSTAPSSAFFLYDTLEMVSGGVNSVPYIFSPWNTKYAVGMNTTSPTGWAAPADFVTNLQNYAKLSSMQSQYTLVRPVAHGLRLSCPLSPQTVTGYTHVCLYPISNYGDTTWQVPTSISQMQDCPFYQRFTNAQLIANPITIVNKYSDEAAFRYRDTNDSGTPVLTGTEYRNFGWMMIVVVVTGAPAATALAVENIVHMEGQALSGNLSGDLTSEQWRPSVMAATSEYAANVSPVTAGTNETPGPIIAKASRFIQQCAADIVSPFVTKAAMSYITGRYGASTQPGSNQRQLIAGKFSWNNVVGVLMIL